MTVWLVIDDESFTVVADDDGVEVLHGDIEAVVDLMLSTDDPSFLTVVQSRMDSTVFAAGHLEVKGCADQVPVFLDWTSEAIRPPSS